MKTTIYILVLLLLVTTTAASTDRTNCEQLAKQYQQVHGGDLIFLNPINADGEYLHGRYAGHWMNKAWSPEQGNYYYDSQTKTTFGTQNDVLAWYGRAGIWDISAGEHPPFGIIWS